jgi:hypothetical protein
VYLTFGNKDMGTFTVGRQIGLFGEDVILNDMTLLGVGGPGGAASPAPGNTTLGGIGLGYIYTDWLAQMDYTTPDFAGFNLTAGIFNPIESLTDPARSRKPKKAPAFTARPRTRCRLPMAPSSMPPLPSSLRSRTTTSAGADPTPSATRVLPTISLPRSMCRTLKLSVTTIMAAASARPPCSSMEPTLWATSGTRMASWPS